MIKFIVKRILTIVPVLLGVTFLVYLLMTIAPGNPEVAPLRKVTDPEEKEQLKEELGLNDPILVRYVRMMKGMFVDESGAVSDIIFKMKVFLPNSLKLCFTALAISVVLALPLGIIAAVKQNTLFDGACMVVSLVGVSMPNFWLALILMIVFALNLGWFPTSGSTEPIHIVLPAATLAFINMASIARVTRSSMLEVIRQDYIRTAQAKGVPYNRVIKKHALKNALIPTITVVGVQLGELLSSTIIIENIFAWPGIGRQLMQAIEQTSVRTSRTHNRRSYRHVILKCDILILLAKYLFSNDSL